MTNNVIIDIEAGLHKYEQQGKLFYDSCGAGTTFGILKLKRKHAVVVRVDRDSDIGENTIDIYSARPSKLKKERR